MTTKKKFPDIENPNERLNAMQNTCDKVETDALYHYEYTDDDKKVMREICLDLDDKIDVKIEHKKAVTADVNAELKDLMAEKKDLRTKIRMGFTEKKATLIGFADHENNVMEYFDDQGNFVKSRGLAPSEKQGHIMAMKVVNGGE